MKEVQDLLKRGTFNVILKEELPDGANALTARFVLAIKSNADGEIKFRARYVMGAHRDKLKHFLVHGAQIVQPSLTRLLFAFFSAHGFIIWHSDVNLGYLQCSEPLERRVLVKNPTPKFEPKPWEYLELLKPLYGLGKAGDFWHKSFTEHLKKELHIMPSKSVPSLYSSFRRGDLMRMNGVHVDNFLRTENSNFKDNCKRTQEKLDTSGDETPRLVFTEFNFTLHSTGSFVIDQTSYLKKLESHKSTSSFAEFCSMKMKLAWLANTRANLLFEIYRLALCTYPRFTLDAAAHVKRLNPAIRCTQNNVVHLLFPELELQSISIVRYSGAAFGNNRELASQFWRLILLVDDKIAQS